GSGQFANTTGSVFLGFRAGASESNNNRLYIENSDSTAPLIYGEFDNDKVAVNGGLQVNSTTDGFTLPRMTATQASALTASNGMMIYVTSTDATFTAKGFWGFEEGFWVKL
ncbi:MAG: hypothetical protein AAGJ82_10050, partial [Bacteroidota bacterium]